MAERMTWSDDDLIDGRNRSGVRDDRAAGGGRRIPIVAVVVGGIVAAALVGSGVTWLLLGSGGQRADSSPPPLIKADDKPIKVHPDSPGGMTVENADKLVYSRLRGEPMKGEVERILPEPQRPEKPAAEDVVVTPPPTTQPKGPVPPSAAETGERSAEATPAARSMPYQVDQESEEAEEPPQAPVRATPPAPTTPKAVESKPAPKPVESKPVQVATARPVPAPPPAKPADKPAATTAPATGRYQLQLLAARSPESAAAAWKKIQAKNGDVLGGLGSTVARADLGDRGVFYRLRVGPIADEAKAKSLCSTLASRNVSCLIIRPGV